MDLINSLRQLADRQDWPEIIALASECRAYDGTPADRAWALHLLGCAYWNRSTDEFDLAESVLLARVAAALDMLGGRATKALGIRLITIGRYEEGRRVLRKWLTLKSFWEAEALADLGHVYYAIGYGARYQGDLNEAEVWYTAALQTFTEQQNAHWSELTTCALAQVMARLGRTNAARMILTSPSISGSDTNVAYRLRALTEILAAEGNHAEAIATGNAAAPLLQDLLIEDPWELTELHLLLAKLQFQAGNLVEKEKHRKAALDALAQSPRTDLHRLACLLLDPELAREEVSA